MMGLGTSWMKQMMLSMMTHLEVERLLQQSLLGKTLTSLVKPQRFQMQ